MKLRQSRLLLFQRVNQTIERSDMLFLVCGIIVFSLSNVTAFIFIKRAGNHIAIEKKLELSKLYSELNKYFVSGIIVTAVMTLFLLRNSSLSMSAGAFIYSAFTLVFLIVLGYWLYIEMKRRNYDYQAVKNMLAANALKNIGFYAVIYGIAQYLSKLR